ncbi:MAG: hypothetical protein NC915_05625 [Candidatus Omnitrophica bacterium]|nr:hypothetical protein [Candidatus Omnitrophota bacterium]
MKKKIYLIGILFLSGWIFSGVQYLVFKNEKERLTKELVEKETQILTYKNLLGEVEKAENDIENIVKTLNNLKTRLQTIENKIKQGENYGDKGSKNSQ